MKKIFFTILLTFICFISQYLCTDEAFSQTLLAQSNKDLSQSITPPPYTYTPKNRLGLSFGGSPWDFGVLVDYDRREVFEDYHWTLGGEFALFGEDIIIEPRILWWENKNMSGFYVGPKAYIITTGYDDYDEYETSVGFGAEAGWLYRFPENFDLGVGVDAGVTLDGLWGSLKITAGYLF